LWKSVKIKEKKGKIMEQKEETSKYKSVKQRMGAVPKILNLAKIYVKLLTI